MARKMLELEDAKMLMNFRNFRGLAKGPIPEGNRSFCVYIPEDLVKPLSDDGWNILEDSYHLAEDESPRHYIRVKVRYDRFPPIVILLSNGKRIPLTEDTIGRLDNDEILYADIVVNGSYNKMRDCTTAYLSKMVVEVKPDWFDEKYGNFEDPDPENTLL